jgi:hypothetical protein
MPKSSSSFLCSWHEEVSFLEVPHRTSHCGCAETDVALLGVSVVLGPCDHVLPSRVGKPSASAF